ncbi:MAG: hypothetical protein E7313_01330 [Clostridiales bacterium]|nr:hypothetical protein [Clostridiales bacterium]
MKKLLNYIRELSKKNINIIIFVISIMGLNGLLYIDKIVYGLEHITYNNFKNTILFFLIFYAYKNIIKKNNNNKISIFSILFSIFLSSIIIIGVQLEYLCKIVFEIGTIFRILCLTIDVFIMVYYVIITINNISLKNEDISEKKICFVGFIIIFITSFLAFLAIYPGMFGYDAIYQLQSGLGLSELTEHYSVIYIHMISFVFSLGKNISGDYQLGCAIQSILQIIFLTYVANKVCLEVYRIVRNIKIWCFSVLFFSIFTFYKIMVVSIAQDVIFAGFYVLFFILLMKLIYNSETRKIRTYIFIILEILGICLFRNNGFYTILLILPVIYFIEKSIKFKVILLFIVIGTLVLYKLIIIYIYPNIGVIKNTDSLKEMSSIPSQQLGRVLMINPSGYSEYDLKKLKEYYYDIESLKNACIYNPCIADKQKKELNQKNVNNDKLGYIKLWAKIGIKNPKIYIEAYLYNNLGLWYPNKNYPDSRMYHPLLEYNNTNTIEYNKYYNTNYEVVVERKSKFPIYEKILNKIINQNVWKRFPIVSMFYTIGFYFIMVCFTLCIIIIRKKYRLLIPFSMVISYYLTIFMGPVSLFRYVFPLIMLTPIYLAIILRQDFEVNNNVNKKIQ